MRLDEDVPVQVARLIKPACAPPDQQDGEYSSGARKAIPRLAHHGKVTMSRGRHMRAGNLFADAVAPAMGERLEALISHRNLVIERIISSSDTAPTQYVQSQDEWVALLQGDALLEVAGELQELHPGDYVFLPAGTPHTVRRVSDGALWLAVHLH